MTLRSASSKAFDIETSCNESCNQPDLDLGLRDRVYEVGSAADPASLQVKDLADE